ncbi:MFS transporter [Streptomyces lydicamycinicus]|uniref:Putative major facilitator superfamily transporter n=1 Tax=Streptomyces lydicamycinicus TaxID=1546107 RepID=A0A0P4R477_9ACTN|nr:MFS transporter [Streptomyces lydicamycinicus]USA05270.1 MFS transporter [Streptomyces lydicamycinicus]GAO07538.1 putative major facilitator superfamily transporter [Streptomyces lydicamycinicus]
MTTAMGAALRRIQLGNALSAFGNGFTVPYLYVYVAKVRDLGASTAGVVLAMLAVAALVVLPLTGRAIDRRGPLPVAIAGTVSAAVGALGLGLSATEPLVIASAIALGAGIAVIQPALATMIVWCSTTLTRSRAFATQFFLNNLGLGVGGLVGGLLVDETHASSFVRLFAIEAVMFLVLGAAVATVRLPRGPKVEDPVPTEERAKGAWRAMFADRRMVWLCVLGFVLFFACYGQFESGLAAYATEVTRIAPSSLGIALAANTAAIVAAQFVVLKLVEGRRRSRVMALVGMVWTVAWIAAGVSGLVHGAQVVATTLLISTYALFGIGESMLSPTVAPLVADLAPSSLIGQYNSAFALVKQLALAVGPAVGALMVGHGMYAAYIGMLVLCALGITGLSLWLGRMLRPAQDNPHRAVAAVPAARVPAEAEAVACGA